VRGSNLLDETARVHASFLKDLAPLPGRNFTAGVRYSF
jgi:iron complex outermembrane recepter protein